MKKQFLKWGGGFGGWILLLALGWSWWALDGSQGILSPLIVFVLLVPTIVVFFVIGLMVGYEWGKSVAGKPATPQPAPKK